MHSEYMEYNDYELLYLIRQESEEAFSLLVEQYAPLIAFIAKKFKANSTEFEDFYQVGLMAFIKSIYSYNEYIEATFYSFSTTCVKHAIISFHKRIHNITRDEYQIGHNYNHGIAREESSIYNSKDSLDNYIEEKIILDKAMNDKKILSDFEKRCLNYYLLGHNYNEIALILSLPPKKVDNALTRLKGKLKNLKKIG